MNITWSGIKKFLGWLTDILNVGRNNGWWDDKGVFHTGSKTDGDNPKKYD